MKASSFSIPHPGLLVRALLPPESWLRKGRDPAIQEEGGSRKSYLISSFVVSFVFFLFSSQPIKTHSSDRTGRCPGVSANTWVSCAPHSSLHCPYPSPHFLGLDVSPVLLRATICSPAPFAPKAISLRAWGVLCPISPPRAAQPSGQHPLPVPPPCPPKVHAELLPSCSLSCLSPTTSRIKSVSWHLCSPPRMCCSFSRLGERRNVHVDVIAPIRWPDVGMNVQLSLFP